MQVDPPAGRRRPVNLDIGQYRAFQLAEKLRHAGFGLGKVADGGEGAAADLGGFAHEIAVGRRAQADGEQPRAFEPCGDGGEQLLFVADGAVGQEHHLAQMVRAGRLLERHRQRRAHVGAALGGEACHIGAGAL